MAKGRSRTFFLDSFNGLPDDTSLALTALKSFADDNSNVFSKRK